MLAWYRALVSEVLEKLADDQVAEALAMIIRFLIDLSGHSRRTQILISLLLLEAARKQQLKERLDTEVQAMQYLCMFAELITPLWRDPTQMHLHLTREFLWLTVQDTLGKDVGQCIRDVASLAMLTYSD